MKIFTKFAALFIPVFAFLPPMFSQKDSISSIKNWFREGWHYFPSQQEKEATAAYKLYGFVRTELAFQNRKMQAGVQDLFGLYALPALSNEYGEDINKVASAGLYSITTRLGLQFQMKGILGAERAAARIEADFTGGNDNVLLTLRQANVQLFWKKTELMAGQGWHPLFTENAPVPTLSINSGAPFNPFNRSPQIRCTYHLMDRTDVGKVDLTGALIGQTNYKSVGPDPENSSVQVSSLQFQKNALIPNVFFGATYAHKEWLAGIGLDYKAINPIKTYVNYADVQKKNNHLLHSFSAMAYGSYRQEMLYVTAKAIIGSNLCDHFIIGGYSIGQRELTVDGLTGYVIDYAPFTSLSSYIDLSYGQLFKLNLFGGYSANLGSQKTLNKSYSFFGFGKSGSQVIKDMFRIAACFSYNPSSWTIGLEVQYDNAAWGTINKKGSIVLPANGSRVSGVWCDLAVIYQF